MPEFSGLNAKSPNTETALSGQTGEALHLTPRKSDQTHDPHQSLLKQHSKLLADSRTFVRIERDSFAMWLINWCTYFLPSTIFFFGSVFTLSLRHLKAPTWTTWTDEMGF